MFRRIVLLCGVLALALVGCWGDRFEIYEEFFSNRVENFRNQVHYSPEANWMNDPNGLVYIDGEYHLFYQYNPDDVNHKNSISWGHAVSTDMINWQELPVAIEKCEDENIFSGTVVVDHENTSGLGDGVTPVLVAYYTSRGSDQFQTQSLAYSNDKGYTWKKYSGNPVLVNNPVTGEPSKDFRDPKVFWYAPGNKWVMILSLGPLHMMAFYESTDLLNWAHMSNFGPANAVAGNWEVPDLFELTIEGTTETRWVLAVSVLGGAVAGGSGIQYFVGDFDGTTFTADNVEPIGDYATNGVIFDDFEADSYDTSKWSFYGGNAFGTGPARGSIGIQNTVTGYLGEGLINTFYDLDSSMGIMTSKEFTINHDYINMLVGAGPHPHVGMERKGKFDYPHIPAFGSFDGGSWDTGWIATGNAFEKPRTTKDWGAAGSNGPGFVCSIVGAGGPGDGYTGTLTSPEFTITKDFINFKLAGGNHPAGDPTGEETVNLVVDGTVVRSSTSTGTNEFAWASWDVSEYDGQTGQITIVDANPGGWGFVMVDTIYFDDQSIQDYQASLEYSPSTGAIVYESFEQAGWGSWVSEGDAFAAPRTADDWPAIRNQVGDRFVVTIVGPDNVVSDAHTGTLTSPEFTITKDFINYKSGGGNHVSGSPEGETTMNLLIDGEVVISRAGEGDTNTLSWKTWDVSQYVGQQAQIKIVDSHQGGWGQILVDHIIFDNAPAENPVELSTETAVNLIVNGEVVRSNSGPDTECLDWMSWDVSEYKGQNAQIEIVDLNSGGWGHINVDHIIFSDQRAVPSAERADWADFGSDFYAAITFNNMPGGKAVWMGWVSNWAYGDGPTFPTETWRGFQSIPRELSLRRYGPEDLKLIQRPVSSFSNLYRSNELKRSNKVICEGSDYLIDEEEFTAQVSEIDVTFQNCTADEFGIKLVSPADDEILIGYDNVKGTLFVDRTKSGIVNFHHSFAARHEAPMVTKEDGRVNIKIIVDWSMVEVFGEDGQTVITDLIFPEQGNNKLYVYSKGGKAILKEVKARELQSIWQ